MFNDIHAAIRREKEIKGWTRKKKIALIESMNPKWEDLASEWGKPLPKLPWQIGDPVTGEDLGDSSGQKARAAPQNDKGSIE